MIQKHAWTAIPTITTVIGMMPVLASIRIIYKANDHFSYQNVVECNHAIMLHGNYYCLDISLGLHIAAKNDTYTAIKMSGSESRGQEV